MLLRLYLPRIIHKRWFSAKCMVKMNEALNTKLENEEINPKRHPGIIKTPVVHVPNWVVDAMIKVIGDVPLKRVCTEAVKLAQYLRARHPPIEEEELKNKLHEVETSLLDGKDLNELPEQELQNLRKSTRHKAIFVLKQKVYAWTALQYDLNKSLYYMVGRGAQDYAVLCRIFNEIHLRDEQFKPMSLFDYGSGIGTVIWAASEFWENTIKEYFCVDSSGDMNDLSIELLKRSPKPKRVYHRQYLPASANPKYDIVVSAYSLLESPNSKARLELLIKLWSKTDNYLVIVEQGTNAGFKVVNEARDFILSLSKSDLDCKVANPAHVFSPCPHDFECPRHMADHTPCNFEAKYSTLPLLGPSVVRKELYSYVVLKKGLRGEGDEQWPRIVRPTLVRSKHTICRMCIASGKLQEIIFTASKQGKYTYRCARASKWGDMLPLKVIEPTCADEER